ncbi:MAG: ABC transporter substrate-binding protein, partial [Rubrivivax sp.]|nr:ABC transporter substrate-binding protein [Rubrivivax sp.]
MKTASKMTLKTLVAAATALLLAAPALADVNIGVSISITGAGSGLGNPENNAFKLWPQTVAGEKVNLIILDDASDPGKAVVNARRFVTEDKVDLILGSSVTPTTAAIAPVAAESKTPQITLAPVGVPPDQDHWVFRLPQSFAVMA